MKKQIFTTLLWKSQIVSCVTITTLERFERLMALKDLILEWTKEYSLYTGDVE